MSVSVHAAIEETKRPPKKPLTPFFQFREAEKARGNKLSCQQAGRLWRDMTEEAKAPFVTEYKTGRALFNRYLEDDCGLPPRGAPARKKDKQTEYRGAAIRAVCGTQKGGKGMTGEQDRALGSVLVNTVKVMGRKSSCWTWGKLPRKR